MERVENDTRTGDGPSDAASMPMPAAGDRPRGFRQWLVPGDALRLLLATGLFGAGAAALLLNPDTVGTVLETAKSTVVSISRSGYLLFGAAAVVAAIIVTFSPLGTRRLGTAASRPAISSVSWFCLAFSAGTLSGLSIWAAAEPLYHLAGNPLLNKGQAETAAATAPALRLTHLHWGLHPWALFALVGVAVAWGATQTSTTRRFRPSSALAPLFRRSQPWLLALLVDVFVIAAALLALTVLTGAGATQLDTALAELVGTDSHVAAAAKADAAARAAATRASVDPDELDAFLRSRRADSGGLMYGLIALMAAAAGLAVAGLRRGLALISWIPLALLAGLATALVIAGPTRYLVDTIVNAAGDYLGNLPQLSVSTQPDKAVNPWQGWWTVFYMGTWIALAPLVGLFLAAISRGRSVRQVMIGGFVLPALFTSVTISIFGGAALHAELYGGAGLLDAVRRDAATAVYEMMRITGTDASNGNVHTLLPSVTALLHIFAILAVLACGSWTLWRVGLKGGGRIGLANAIALLAAAVSALLIWRQLGLAGWEMARSALFLVSIPASLYLIAAAIAFLQPVRENQMDGAEEDAASHSSHPALAASPVDAAQPSRQDTA